MDEATSAVLGARALVLLDLRATGLDTAAVVSMLDDVVVARQWWVEQWPQGAPFVAGQVAQDLQDRVLESFERWPPCPRASHVSSPPPHELHIDPDLGPDPHWVCEPDGVVVAALGGLGGAVSG